MVNAVRSAPERPFLVAGPPAVGPVLRLQSYYVPLVTLGLAQMLFIAALSSGDIAGVPTIMFLPGLELPRGPAFAIFVWVLAIVGALIAWSLSATHFGRFAEVVRDNPVAAVALPPPSRWWSRQRRRRSQPAKPRASPGRCSPSAASRAASAA